MAHIAAAASKRKTSAPSSTTACAHLRAEYHDCFNKSWYSEKYVKGQGKEEECTAEWKKYRSCLAEHLQDEHLKRFLEAEGSGDSDTKADPARSVDGNLTSDVPSDVSTKLEDD